VVVGRDKRVSRGQARASEFLVGRGKLSATEITDEYDVRIEYRDRESPRVFVDRPALARRPQEPDKPIPHTYDSDKPGLERPCVFLPAQDWDPTMPIGKTIVPWFRCWLLDYEIWHATGVWSGGGVSHSTPKTDPAA
jgi:hypothetical protein